MVGGVGLWVRAGAGGAVTVCSMQFVLCARHSRRRRRGSRGRGCRRLVLVTNSCGGGVHFT